MPICLFAKDKVWMRSLRADAGAPGLQVMEAVRDAFGRGRE